MINKRIISFFAAVLILGTTIVTFAEVTSDKLVLLTGYDNSEINAWFTRDTGIEIEIRQPLFQGTYIEEAARIFTTRNDQLDILFIPAHQGLFSIKAKGYYTSLNDNADILKALGELYPAFSRALTAENGDIVGWLCSVQPLVRMEDSALLLEYGIKSPKSFDDFLDASKHLFDNDALSSGRPLADVTSYSRQSMLDWFMELYIAQDRQRDEKISFDHPEFRTLAERIKNEVPKEPPYPAPANMEDSGEGQDASPIFMMNVVFEWINSYMLPMPAIFEESAGTVETYALVMLVNPFSPRKDAAISYLEYFSRWQEGMSAYTYVSTMDQPQENPAAANEITLLREAMAPLEIQEQENSLTPEKLEELTALRQSLKDPELYWISQEAIDHYKSMVPGVYVAEANPVSYDKALHFLATQYAGGVIDIDSFIEECQKHVDLIYGE